jgi:peptidoglycan/xylan/chitin deacetylase (PgdA/CDA1 family)
MTDVAGLRAPKAGRSRAPGPAAAALAAAVAAALVFASCRSGPAAAFDPCRAFLCDHGGIVRGDTSARRLSLVFTGGSFADGGEVIRRALRAAGVKAGFFFTGDFYRTPEFDGIIRGLAADGHYLGAHSDKHLLYCPWEDREKTLVGRDQFRADLEANFRELARFGIRRRDARFFIPPYEWYNRDIAAWARDMGLVLFNFTPGTSSNADYTTPSMPEYLSSQTIFDRILACEEKDPHGLNGFLLLIHIGTDTERTDKFYLRLADLIKELQGRGYAFARIDELLRSN